MIQQKHSFLLASSSKSIKQGTCLKAFYQITSSFHCPFTQACWICPSLVILEATLIRNAFQSSKISSANHFFIGAWYIWMHDMKRHPYGRSRSNAGGLMDRQESMEKLRRDGKS
jgi:hypothetical protein